MSGRCVLREDGSLETLRHTGTNVHSRTDQNLIRVTIRQIYDTDIYAGKWTNKKQCCAGEIISHIITSVSIV